MTPQEALDAARWRYREDDALAVEERLPNRTKLARKGHDVRVLSPSLFDGGQLIRRREGTLASGTEPRKDGDVVGF